MDDRGSHGNVCKARREGSQSVGVGAGLMCSRSSQGTCAARAARMVERKEISARQARKAAWASPSGLGGCVWALAFTLPQTGCVATYTSVSFTNRLSGGECLRGAGERLLMGGYRVSFQNDENVMELCSSIDCTALQIC